MRYCLPKVNVSVSNSEYKGRENNRMLRITEFLIAFGTDYIAYLRVLNKESDETINTGNNLP